MSAAVCGSKRSYFFEELPSPPTSKKLRCSSSSSPARFSPPSLPDQLKPQIQGGALEGCGNDLDSSVKNLNEHSLESAEHNFASVEEARDMAGKLTVEEDIATSENMLAPSNLPANGVEWVELFVSEMMNATSVDDARARASRVLEILEKSISVRAAEEATQSFQKENLVLKEQIEVLIRENTILKRAVAIQHERQKEFEDKNGEIQQLKQLLSQYHEQIRTLEVNNYALMMHLRQAQQSNPISGHFHPDVF